MSVERRLLAWTARRARLLLVGGGVWLTAILGLAALISPSSTAGTVVAFAVAGVVGIAPMGVGLLRMRVPVRVRVSNEGLVIRRESRTPPVEGTLAWPTLRLTWTRREDGENLAVERHGEPTLLLSAANDDQLAMLRRDIARSGIEIRSR